eukprot:2468693-Pyramimonas_sp.AAC.1
MGHNRMSIAIRQGKRIIRMRAACAILSVRGSWWCNSHVELAMVNSTDHAIIPCGDDCDECLVLAGAYPRPRYPAHARRRSGQLIRRCRRGRGGADPFALPTGHFSASRPLGRA